MKSSAANSQYRCKVEGIKARSLALVAAVQDIALRAEHLTSEFCVTTQGRGRKVKEWKAKAGHPDNHWLDCLVGCAVGGRHKRAVLYSKIRPTCPVGPGFPGTSDRS